MILPAFLKIVLTVERLEVFLVAEAVWVVVAEVEEEEEVAAAAAEAVEVRAFSLFLCVSIPHL